jgi:hypothetical protein
MSPQYLIDEHVPAAIVRALRQQEPTLIVWRIGDAGTPARGCADPELLIWCETHDFVLVTDNRRSMPVHLAAHLQAGRYVPGIFVLGARMSMGEIIDMLIDAAGASLEGEHQDQIRYLQSL